jgi:hypothetical protein
MDIAFLPFAASVLADAFHDGSGQRAAIALHGGEFEVAAMLSNVMWWYARHDRRLLADGMDLVGVNAAGRRFQLALAWTAVGTPLDVLLPLWAWPWSPRSSPTTGCRSAARSPGPKHRPDGGSSSPDHRARRR